MALVNEEVNATLCRVIDEVVGEAVEALGHDASPATAAPDEGGVHPSPCSHMTNSSMGGWGAIAIVIHLR